MTVKSSHTLHKKFKKMHELNHLSLHLPGHQNNNKGYHKRTHTLTLTYPTHQTHKSKFKSKPLFSHHPYPQQQQHFGPLPPLSQTHPPTTKQQDLSKNKNQEHK